MEIVELISTILKAAPILIALIFILQILIAVIIIKLICQHMAKENAKAFNYDYLAKRTAEELYYKMMIIEAQKSAYKGATSQAGDQSQGNRE